MREGVTSGRRESAGMRSIQWIDRREERPHPGRAGVWRRSPILGEAGGLKRWPVFLCFGLRDRKPIAIG